MNKRVNFKEKFAEWFEIVAVGLAAGVMVSFAPTEKEAICISTFLIVSAIIRECQTIKRKLDKLALKDSSYE
jgi:hypothetical protein